jgi:hypothetical protein
MENKPQDGDNYEWDAFTHWYHKVTVIVNINMDGAWEIWKEAYKIGYDHGMSDAPFNIGS